MIFFSESDRPRSPGAGKFEFSFSADTDDGGETSCVQLDVHPVIEFVSGLSSQQIGKKRYAAQKIHGTVEKEFFFSMTTGVS